MGQWLADIGLPHLSNLFIQNNVNGRELLFMESARLKVMYMYSRSPIPKNQDCLHDYGLAGCIHPLIPSLCSNVV